MAQINNNEVVDKARDGLKLSASEKVPNATEDKVRIVYVVNPQPNVFTKRTTAADATSGTIHTTHATKKTFLIGAYLSVSKDAVSDSIQSEIVIFPKGKGSVTFFRINYEPTTAGNFAHKVILPIPLELEPNTLIVVTNSAATASIDSTANIYLYEEEPL